ncbi:MAG TPA: TerC family protein [Verrucomicrobiae bacterium]|nr:TerC family protein [Verrucomicrobiae bacterium]
MEWVFTVEGWMALATLTLLETVLGIDNVVFISILAGKLPHGQRAMAWRTGLGLAMVTRVLLLCAISWMAGMTAPLFAVFGHGVSGRDLILLAGGLFLIGKSTFEIHDHLEGEEGHAVDGKGKGAGFWHTIGQILALDVVFSLDSVITAVGMARHLSVMIAAVVISLGIMLWCAAAIGGFVNRHPTVKMLALSFLLLIGFALVMEGCGQHLPKGYIYAAMAFSLGVEMLNLKAAARAKARAVVLHNRFGTAGIQGTTGGENET